MPSPIRRSRLIRTFLFVVAFVIAATALASTVILWLSRGRETPPFRFVSTVAGTGSEFSEPFGIAVKGGDTYVSDGQSGKIWLIRGDSLTLFAQGLDTPSGIAFDGNGTLLVADSGTHTIKSIDKNGAVAIVAGVEGRSGFADGDAAAALFNAPISIAVGPDGKVYVADTYNDSIRVIENGTVSTLAGSTPGYTDGVGAEAKFDTPCDLALWRDKLVVADTGNRRIRVVEPDGRVWTLAGDGRLTLKDGLLASSSFVQPSAIVMDTKGSIIVADGNAIRQIGGDVIPVVRTISDETRGTRDGPVFRSLFNRPSGIAFDNAGDLLVADSDNRLVRRLSATRSGHEITKADVEALSDNPDEFRSRQPPRWPFDPPEGPREIAGTLGELRGEIPAQKDPARFHNGLDIAGNYGETARLIRDEKVLQPLAVSNFNTLRELIRLPSLGYIHVRLGRDASSKPFGDRRFQFKADADGKLTGVRVPRGTRFTAGEPIGTLNAMNHVHLIAGRSGFEMNALDALRFPGLKDTKVPVIESVTFTSPDGQPAKAGPAGRIQLTEKTHIVMRAYDQLDGNAARRRLGIYQAGYQVLRSDHTPLTDVNWTIKFDRMPPAGAAKFVYADGSRSGAKGETIFNYIVTNRVEGDIAAEDFFDPSTLDEGYYIVRVIAADYFGNGTYLDTQLEVKRPPSQ